MNTLILSASRSRYGSRASATSTTLPSAGDSTALASCGATRGGSRKNWAMKTTASQATRASSHGPVHDNASAMTIARARNAHPSRAMIGCGYSGAAIDELLRLLVDVLGLILSLLLHLL